MVEIIVKAPRRKNRSYVFSSDTEAERFVKMLEKKAILVREDRPRSTRSQIEHLEYEEDVRDVKKALAEYKRTGRSYTLEEIKAELGL